MIKLFFLKSTLNYLSNDSLFVTIGIKLAELWFFEIRLSWKFRKQIKKNLDVIQLSHIPHCTQGVASYQKWPIRRMKFLWPLNLLHCAIFQRFSIKRIKKSKFTGWPSPIQLKSGISYHFRMKKIQFEWNNFNVIFYEVTGDTKIAKIA